MFSVNKFLSHLEGKMGSLRKMSYTTSRQRDHSSGLPPSFEKAESTLGERFVEYLGKHDNPPIYKDRELGEVGVLLDWIASCLVHGSQIMERGSLREGVMLYHYMGITQKDKIILVGLLDPVLRILYIEEENRRQLEQISEDYQSFIEICIINGDRMGEAENFIDSVRYVVPYILLEQGSVLRGDLDILAEERVIATLWNSIIKEVLEPSYTFYVPVDEEGNEDKEISHYHRINIEEAQ
ncbi:hypothetical protein RHMOL_RhmolMtG0004000 (mitochondrion) [Rhododendron molle]|nr:hypothetical protein RHMOL_RhmolMtG0004000 [Rhododendron molle]